MKRVLILGCGPAGLMAAAGVHMATEDVEIRIASNKKKSGMYGAQYLHKPIPTFTPATPVDVAYTLQGTEDEYRKKVYDGTPFVGDLSVQVLPETHKAWDIRQTYNNLWEFFEDDILDVHIDPEGLAYVEKSLAPDVVISTIPAPALCWQGHTFRSQPVWAAGSAPDLGIDIPYPCDDNTVICNGLEMPTWYRLSNVYGHKTVEWSMASVKRRPPVGKPSAVPKPIDNNCDCWPNLITAGRYGKWKKGLLSHTAYQVGYNVIQEAISLENRVT